MKKVISLILISILIFLTGCSGKENKAEFSEDNDIVSAVWMYYIELSMQEENGGSEDSFRKKISKMLDVCAENGINTVFFQVRPYCDAFYPSKIFPWTVYLSGKQGKAIDYDPLRIALDEAHKRAIALHAWINPFRILSGGDVSKLSDDNPALRWIKEKSNNVVHTDDGWYFCPASEEAGKIVIDGVREIVENYDVDGIHIDDYFYPSRDESVDKAFYDEYKKNGGELELKKWRLNTVSAFVSQLYAATKSVSGKCIFSISPAGNIGNDYSEHYADVRLWCSRRGYADWIIPQLYYGFENEKLTFDVACKLWSVLPMNSSVKMIYGIGSYRINNSDSEWDAGSGIVKKQISLCKKKSNYSGIALFSYSSLAEKGNAPEFAGLSGLVFDESAAE